MAFLLNQILLYIGASRLIKNLVKDKEALFVGHIEEIMAYAWFNFKEWSHWSACSSQGVKTRTRECPGLHCFDPMDEQATDLETEDCTVS